MFSYFVYLHVVYPRSRVPATDLIAELRARSPVAKKKKIGKPMNAKNFGLVMTSWRHFCPSVHNPTMPMRPCLFGVKLYGEMRLQQKC